MKNVSINQLGVVNYDNFKMPEFVKRMQFDGSYDRCAFRSCGTGCGDSNCS